MGVSRASATDVLGAHVLKHGSLLMAAMLGGAGKGCPGGTTTTGGSKGSAGGAGIAFMMLVSVQFSVAAEQLPASPACALAERSLPTGSTRIIAFQNLQALRGLNLEPCDYSPSTWLAPSTNKHSRPD